MIIARTSFHIFSQLQTDQFRNIFRNDFQLQIRFESVTAPHLPERHIVIRGGAKLPRLESAHGIEKPTWPLTIRSEFAVGEIPSLQLPIIVLSGRKQGLSANNQQRIHDGNYTCCASHQDHTDSS